MNRAQRRLSDLKKIQKRKHMKKYVPYWVQTYKLPGKLENKYDRLEEEALERDIANGVVPWSHGSERSKVRDEYWKARVEKGYLKPKNSSELSKFIKKHSRKHLRMLTKEELRKDPDEISRKTGNNENKYHEHDWELD